MNASGIAIVFAGSLVLAASAFPDYPSKPAKQCPVSVENGSVTAGLETVENPDGQKKYFGADLAKKGFLPVFVVIENGLKSDSVIFDKRKVALSDSASASPGQEQGCDRARPLPGPPFLSWAVLRRLK